MLAATAVSDPGRAQVVTRQPAAHADAIAAFLGAAGLGHVEVPPWLLAL